MVCNQTIKQLSWYVGWKDHGQTTRRIAEKYRETLNIQIPSIYQQVLPLSESNQQKVAQGKGPMLLAAAIFDVYNRTNQIEQELRHYG